MFFRIFKRIGAAVVASAGLAQVWSWNPQTKRFGRPPKKKALLIGINYTDQHEEGRLGELIGPHRDVTEMRDLLINQYKYGKDDIVIMTDAAVPQELQPTRENILNELQNLVVDPQPGDQFFFLYSGHSHQKPCLDDSEEDGLDEFIVPCDAVGPDGPNGEFIEDKIILDDELRKYLVDTLPPGSSLVAIFDTCHSATLLDLPHYRCNRISGWTSLVRRVIQRLFELYENNLASPKAAMLQKLSDSINKQKHKLKGKSQPKPRSFSFDSTLDHKDLSCLAFPAFQWSSTAKSRPKFCSGFCRPSNFAEKAYVVCISACKDKQMAFEDPLGVSMTIAIIEFLRDNRHPPLKDLMLHISHNLCDLSERMKDELNKYEEEYKLYILSGGQPVPAPVFNLDHIQDPQMSSHTPLDMDALLYL